MLGTGDPRPRRVLRPVVAAVIGVGVLVPSALAQATPEDPPPTTSTPSDAVDPSVPPDSTIDPIEPVPPSTEPAETTTTTAAPTATTTTTTAAPTTTVVPTTVAPSTTVPHPSVEAAPVACRVTVVLKWAARGSSVSCLKLRLTELGHRLNGPIDYFDLSTVNAVKAFQRARGLSATGIAGPTTTWRLGIWRSTTPVGCTVHTQLSVRGLHPAVQCLEYQLALRGYALNGPNHYYDNTTVLAVQAFQRTVGLPANGVATVHTLYRLGLRPAPPAPPAPPTPPPGACRLTAAVKLRDYGEPVRCVEARLIAIGYRITGGANLYYAYETFTAVQAYQRAIGVSPDGVAGAYTLHRLGIWGGPTPNQFALPSNSGTGRRVVFSRAQQRVWAVDSNGVVVKSHRVSGRLYEPRAGTYSVYSRSMYTYSASNPSIKWRYMVRFTYGNQGGRIGFHEIPTQYGRRLQSDSQLGQPLSGGCVRQSTPDAQWMWNWAGIGTKVVVL